MGFPPIRTRFAAIVVTLVTGCSDHVPTVAVPIAADVTVTSSKPKGWIGDLEVVRAIVTPPITLGKVPTRDTLGHLLPTSELVHPSVACSSYREFACYMMMTPYPESDGKLENASILLGIDTMTWIEPPQAVNPIIAKAPPRWVNNSDPDLNWDATSQRYFFTNRLASYDSNVVSVLGTSDAAHFSSPRRVVAVPSHRMMSPSFTVGPDGGPRLYSVRAAACQGNDPVIEVRLPTSGKSRYEDLDWGEPQTVSMDQPGFVPWHLEIRWVPDLNLYIGLIVAHVVGGACTDDELFVVTSQDGMHFTTYPHPIMWTRNPWMTFKAVYRSTFVYDAESGLLRLWISAYTVDYHWRLLYASVSWGDMIQRLEYLRTEQGFSGLYTRFGHSPRVGANGSLTMP